MRRLTLIALLLALAPELGAQTQPASPKPAAQAGPAPAAPKSEKAKPGLEVPFTQFTLHNGLHVILHEDHTVPLVTVNVWYHVG